MPLLQHSFYCQVLQQPQDAAPVLADGSNGCHLVVRQQAPFDSDKALQVGDALHSAPEEGREGALLSISKGKTVIPTSKDCRGTYGAALSRRRSTMRQMCAVSTARQAVSESRTIA